MAIWMEREGEREYEKSPAERTKNGGPPWLPVQGRENNDWPLYAHTTAFFDETKSQNVRINVFTVKNELKRTNSRDYGAPRGTQSSPKLRYKCYREPCEAQRSPLPKVHPPSKAPSQLWELSLWLTFSPFTQGSGDARKTHPFYLKLKLVVLQIY